MRKELKIILLSEIKTEEVKWLWYPYIPFGKVTIVQGDCRGWTCRYNKAPARSSRRRLLAGPDHRRQPEYADADRPKA